MCQQNCQELYVCTSIMYKTTSVILYPLYIMDYRDSYKEPGHYEITVTSQTPGK